MRVNRRPAQFEQGENSTALTTPVEAGVIGLDESNGALQISGSTGTAIVWSPVGGTVVKSDAAVTGVKDVQSLIRTTPGTPTNGIGGRVIYNLPNAAGTLVNAGTFTWVLTDVTVGSEDSTLTFAGLVAGAAQNFLALSDSGVNDETFAVLLIRQGGTVTAKRVLQGAADSGGLGFRQLIVAN